MVQKIFISFTLSFYKNIKDGYTTLEKAEENKKDLKKLKEKWEYKSEEQKRDNYSKIASKTKYRSIHVERLKILTPKCSKDYQ